MKKRELMFFGLIFIVILLSNVDIVFGVVDGSSERFYKIIQEIASLKTTQEKLKYCLEHIHEDALWHEGMFEKIPVGIDTNLAELLWIGKPAVPELIKLLNDDTPAGCISWGFCEKEDSVAKKALWVLRMFHHDSFDNTYSDGLQYEELPAPEKREEFIKKWQEWWQKNNHREFDTYNNESRIKTEPFKIFLKKYLNDLN